MRRDRKNWVRDFSEPKMETNDLIPILFTLNYFSFTEWLPHTKACVRKGQKIVMTLPPSPPGLAWRKYQGRGDNLTLVDEETRRTSILWWASYTPSKTGQNSITFRLKYYDPATQWTIFTKRGSGGIMADVCLFLARPYVFCAVFLYSRTVMEARLRFFNTALPK